MFKRRMVLGSLALAALVASQLAPKAPSAEEEAVDANLETYATGDGETYFALSLMPTLPAPADKPHDIVVAFDTSASQAGDYRLKALGTLESLLSALGPADRVHLVAVDINAVPMTESFVAPDSPEMEAALDKLRARVPLGSTDMTAALDAVLESFSEDLGDARACIYIGDGQSSGDLLDAADLERLTSALVERRVPVTGYAIGPQADGRLLAALANQTGGALAIDGENVTDLQVGRFLAASAQEVVAWPTSVEWPAELAEVYPKPCPPLRGDRDTVVVGVGGSEEPLHVSLTAEVDGQPTTMEWTIAGAPPSDDHAYLASLVRSAQGDDGVSLPTLGSLGLAETRLMLSVAAHNLNKLAGQAVATGDPVQGERLAEAALRIDPTDDDARAIRRVAAQDQDLRLAAQDDDSVAPSRAEPVDDPLAGEGDLLESFDRDRRILAEKIQAEVLDAIDRGRGQLGTNPQAAMDELKIYRESVLNAPELDEDVRDQLLRQIEGFLREAANEAERILQIAAAQGEIEAQGRERERLIERLYLRDQKVEQLIATFGALVDEGRFREAEDVAFIARDLAPESSVPVGAVYSARVAGYFAESYALREARHRGVVDTLASVERAHIPTPDEPPILYPSAEVWLELTERRAKYNVVDLAVTGEAEQNILAELDKPTTIDCLDQPIGEVLTIDLADRHRIPIILDKAAIEEVGADMETPVSWTLRGIKLRSALKHILAEFELTYIIQDEVLLITSRDKADSTLTTKVYPVADLVLPIPDTGASGLGGVGGQSGFGGGGGGFGGQGGGGGFGGGGGGFGGQGGGGGGGFFNVPAPRQPFRAFAVDDDLRLSSKKPADEAAPAKEAPQPVPKPAVKAEVIRLEIPEGGDPEAAWSAYFVAHSDPPVPRAAVRETARHLMSKKVKDFDQAIGMMLAALRHGQGQPWMYEGLGLAMQADLRPAHQIERTLMSAVDFNGSLTDRMYLAVHLARCGRDQGMPSLDRRALKLFRDVSALEPTRPEPYQHGLDIATRLNDIEAIQWAAVGILDQAWPRDQLKIWDHAHRVAISTIEQLREEGRDAQADRFETAVNEAKQRDLVAVVNWTGQADVDISIQEPSGAICSLRNPRTTGGGVMVGDAYGGSGDASTEGLSEVYVCPRAFDGKYRMLVRRVWGKVPAGKVTVDIYTHYGTPHARRMRKQIPLGEKDAMVGFELADGRRTEALAEHQLANAAADQLAMGRQLLARQLAALADSDSLGRLANSRRNSGLVERLLNRRGQVGFMPVIIFLPQGANLGVTQAIVSADRRYVRVSPAPFFSQITEVTTFNFVSGEEGQGNVPGGGGGGGGGGFF